MCGFNIIDVTPMFAEATSPPRSLCATPQYKDQEQNRNRSTRVRKKMLCFMKHTIGLLDGCLVRQNPITRDDGPRSKVPSSRETLLQLY